jgi:NAD(P)-dependent dehydrogenase (short-subunit alcohol dehydrogenase family)
VSRGAIGHAICANAPGHRRGCTIATPPKSSARRRKLPPFSVSAAASWAAADVWPIDILVNNAGGSLHTPQRFLEESDADWTAVMELNLSAAVRASRAVLPGMVERRYGRIAKGLPADARASLEKACAAAQASESYREQQTKLRMPPVSSTGAAFPSSSAASLPAMAGSSRTPAWGASGERCQGSPR